MSDLDGLRALVTGGTSGLGRAMAEALAGAGARVAVVGRDRRRAERVAQEIGRGALGLPMDVRQPASVNRTVDEVFGALDGLDLLVNNAGIGMRTVNPRFMTDPQPFWTVTPDGFRDVVETKVAGTFLVSREVVPRMLSSGDGGRVITVSMNEGTMIRRGFAPYGPAGAGVEALARVMAEDLAETDVRANILLPGGATATGMIPDDTPDEVRARLLPASVMSEPIVWLASAAAADLHGARIVASQFREWLSAGVEPADHDTRS